MTKLPSTLHLLRCYISKKYSKRKLEALSQLEHYLVNGPSGYISNMHAGKLSKKYPKHTAKIKQELEA